MMGAAWRMVIAAFAVLVLGWSAGSGVARADAAAEAYVRNNAPAALAALSEPGLTAAQRQAKFAELMERFADFPRISDFVLGRHAAKVRSDAALRTRWRTVFRNYAMAVYQDQLDQYRGNDVRVLPGSRDATTNGRFYSVVSTEVIIPGREPFRTDWRLLRGEDGTFRVVDAAVRIGDQIIWLAVQQRSDFQAILDRNNGSIEALITEVERQTAVMRERIAARERGRNG